MMSGISVESKEVKYFVSHLLNDFSFISEFEHSYYSFLLSNYGPSSNYTLIQNSVSCETLTSSSSQILKQISFIHPCCKFINALIKAQERSYGAHSLFVGILCSGLMVKCLKLEHCIPRQIIIDIVDRLQYSFVNFLSEKAKSLSYKINIGSVDEVLSIVNSFLNSKCSSNLNRSDRKHIGIKIVEAFLKTIPTDVQNDFGHVFVSNFDSSSSLIDSKVINGVLYREMDLTKAELEIFLKNLVIESSEIKIILFSIPLDPNCSERKSVKWLCKEMTLEESYTDILSHLLCNILKKNDIKVLASQKYIHPCIKYNLFKEGILVLERLGTSGASDLSKIAGCCSISSLAQIHSDLICNFVGFVSRILVIDVDDKIYLNLLPAKESYDVTFVLTGQDPHVTVFLKVNLMIILRFLAFYIYKYNLTLN